MEGTDAIEVIQRESERQLRFQALIPVSEGQHLTATGRTRVEAIRRLLARLDDRAQGKERASAKGQRDLYW